MYSLMSQNAARPSVGSRTAHAAGLYADTSAATAAMNNNMRANELLCPQMSSRPKRLHISNIPFKMNGSDLEYLFGSIGPVSDSEIVGNEKGSKGYGFVTFKHEADAERAKRLLNGTIIDGRVIEVNDAMPRNKFRISPAPALLRAGGYERNPFLAQWSARHTLVPRSAFHCPQTQQSPPARRLPPIPLMPFTGGREHDGRSERIMTTTAAAMGLQDDDWYRRLSHMLSQRLSVSNGCGERKSPVLPPTPEPNSSQDSSSANEYRLFQ